MVTWALVCVGGKRLHLRAFLRDVRGIGQAAVVCA
jgi:hypothetical protein